MKKLLFISNIIGKGIGSFSLASIKASRQIGYEVHIAANFSNLSLERRKEDEDKFVIKIHHIDFVRTPYDIRNRKAYHQVIELIKREKIDMIHCNTPIGGVIGRLAGHRCKVSTIIYEAHGFHFWKGAPIKNWLIYYPIERVLAHYSDALITINQEDLSYAKKMRLKTGGKVYCVHGVGIEIDRFSKANINREFMRTKLNLAKNDVMLLAIGDFTTDKNHMFIMKTLNQLPQNYKLYICGDGVLRKKYEAYIKKYKLADRIILLGYRTDIPDILNASDLFVMPSTMEGLPRAIMEAMAAKVPVICSRNKGHLELIKDLKCIFGQDSEEEFLFSISYALKNKKELAHVNYQNLQNFTLSKVVEELKTIYREMEENV